MALVKRFDGEFPERYFKEVLEYMDLSKEQFWQLSTTRAPRTCGDGRRCMEPAARRLHGGRLMANEFVIGGRRIGREHPPLVIAEIGINHEGDFAKAIRMVDDAAPPGASA